MNSAASTVLSRIAYIIRNYYRCSQLFTNVAVSMICALMLFFSKPIYVVNVALNGVYRADSSLEDDQQMAVETHGYASIPRTLALLQKAFQTIQGLQNRICSPHLINSSDRGTTISVCLTNQEFSAPPPEACLVICLVVCLTKVAYR